MQSYFLEDLHLAARAIWKMFEYVFVFCVQYTLQENVIQERGASDMHVYLVIDFHPKCVGHLL